VSVADIIAGVLLTAMFVALVVAWWHGRHHIFSFLFLACTITLAIAMINGRQPPVPKKVAAEAAPHSLTKPTADTHAGSSPLAAARQP
jgi:predicted branched-subunit amino acid permease